MSEITAKSTNKEIKEYLDSEEIEYENDANKPRLLELAGVELDEESDEETPVKVADKKAKYSDKELKTMSKSYFKQHPNTDTFYFVQDGTPFFKLGHANLHARNKGGLKVVVIEK